MLDNGVGVTVYIDGAVVAIVNAQLMTRSKESKMRAILQIYTCATWADIIHTARKVF